MDHARADVWRERSVWEAGDDAGDARGGAGAVGAVHDNDNDMLRFTNNTLNITLCWSICSKWG